MFRFEKRAYKYLLDCNSKNKNSLQGINSLNKKNK